MFLINGVTVSNTPQKFFDQKLLLPGVQSTGFLVVISDKLGWVNFLQKLARVCSLVHKSLLVSQCIQSLAHHADNQWLHGHILGQPIGQIMWAWQPTKSAKIRSLGKSLHRSAEIWSYTDLQSVAAIKGNAKVLRSQSRKLNWGFNNSHKQALRNSACSTASHKAILSVAMEDRAMRFKRWESQYIQATGTRFSTMLGVVTNRNIPPWEPCRGIFPGEASLTATTVALLRSMLGITREYWNCWDLRTKVLACFTVPYVACDKLCCRKLTSKLKSGLVDFASQQAAPAVFLRSARVSSVTSASSWESCSFVIGTFGIFSG